MQMQDWQGRKMVRSQQMDGGAQSSSGTSPRLPYAALPARPPAAPHSPVGRGAPQGLCSGPTAEGAWGSDGGHCWRKGRWAAAGPPGNGLLVNLFPRLPTHTHLASPSPHSGAKACPARGTCLPSPGGHRSSSVESRTVLGKPEPVVTLLTSHCPVLFLSLFIISEREPRSRIRFKLMTEQNSSGRLFCFFQSSKANTEV